MRNKFLKYKPEPASMPFHTRLLGKDRLALFSFIHSLNTVFGTAIFEPVALALAQKNFKRVATQVKSGNQMSEKAQYVIQEIMDNLTAAHAKPDKKSETERLREVCR